MDFYKITKINETVQLDGNYFEEVTFKNCKLVFTGLETNNRMGLVNCKILKCTWHFEGAAAHTVNFLNSLSTGMGPAGKIMVKNLFKDAF